MFASNPQTAVVSRQFRGRDIVNVGTTVDRSSSQRQHRRKLQQQQQPWGQN
jgi:hypothetical protein